MLEIPIESTHIFFFFYFFKFFLFFFFVFLGGAHWPSFEGVPSLIKSASQSKWHLRRRGMDSKCIKEIFCVNFKF